MRIAIFLLPLFAFATNLAAQSPLKIELKAIYHASQIKLRWVPANFETWEYCRDSGFVLERLTYSNATTPLTPAAMSASRVTINFPPKTQAAWETAMNADPLTGVAAGALFGESFDVIPPTEGIVTAYNSVAERDNRFGLSLFAADNSTSAANMMNLVHTDNTVTANFQYIYIVKPNGTPSVGFIPEQIQIKAATPTTFTAPTNLQGAPGNQKATLSWAMEVDKIQYSSYDVYRAVGAGAYSKVNTVPVLPTESPDGKPGGWIYFVDSLPDNTTTFKYKVRGHSPFGIDGPFSAIVNVKGKADPLAANIAISNVEHLTAGMEITWSFLNTLESSIKGFNVYRAEKGDGITPLVKLNATLISKTLRKYTHTQPGYSNYYVVEAVDLNDNPIQSQFALSQKMDDGPPLPPNALSGEPLGDDGTVRLIWPASTSPDAKGYRVFMSDLPNGEYIQITSTWIEETSLDYHLNPNSIVQYRYFKVKTVDFRENLSVFSPMAQVAMLDLHAPSKPVITLAEPQSNGNFVKFNSSKSKDVVSHRLLRRLKGEAEWIEIQRFMTPANSYSVLDTNIKAKFTFEYMAQAEDDAGLKSNSKIYPLKALVNGIRDSVENFSVSFSKPSGGIVLEWEYQNLYGADVFVIYRTDKFNNLIEVAAVPVANSMNWGLYQGANPIVQGNVPNGGDLGQYQDAANPSQFASGINFNQPGNTNVNLVSYSHVETNYQPFTNYTYSVAVRFRDGSSSRPTQGLSVRTW